MPNYIRRYSSVLEVLPGAPNAVLVALCRFGDSEFLKVVSEISYNVLSDSVDLSAAQRRRINPLEKSIKILANKRTTLQRKRGILKRQGPQLVKEIIPPVLPLVSVVRARNEQ